MNSKNSLLYVFLDVALCLVIVFGVFNLLNVYDNGTVKVNDDLEENETESVKNKDTVIVKDLDISKCLNGLEGVTYSNPKSMTEGYGIVPYIEKDKRNVTISIDGDGIFNKNSSIIVPSSFISEDHEFYVKGFEKDLKQVFIGEFGQDTTGLALIYLFKDDSIGYTKIFRRNVDSNGNLYFSYNYSTNEGNNYIFFVDDIYKDINEKIVNVYTASYNIPNGGGANTVIASTVDGSFYDLSKFMKF